MGTHDFKYNKVPLFARKNREYQYCDVCCPETSSCASKPLLLRCNLVIPQCMYQVLLRLKEVQMGTHDFKYNKVPLFGRKQGISILRCLLPRNWLLCQQAVITAMKPGHTTMYVPSFIKIERGSDGGP